MLKNLLLFCCVLLSGTVWAQNFDEQSAEKKADASPDNKILLTIHISKCDYDDEENLIISYSIEHPQTVDCLEPDVLYYDIDNWSRDPSYRTVLVRAHGKAAVQVGRGFPMFHFMPMDHKTPKRVLRPGDSIHGYVKLKPDDLQEAFEKRGIAPDDDCEFMLTLNRTYFDKEAPWVFEPSEDGRTVISEMDEFGEWKTRHYTEEEEERLSQRLRTVTPRIIIVEEEEEEIGEQMNAVGAKPLRDPNTSRFRATSAWVKIKFNRETHEKREILLKEE